MQHSSAKEHMFLSYVPLLTTPKGILKPLSEKDTIYQMLAEASKEYPIEKVAWTIYGKTYNPVFIMPHAKEVAMHMEEWAQGATQAYFTLVWLKTGSTGYNLALLPNYDKSLRRFRVHNPKHPTSPPLTIMGHTFLYMVQESQFPIEKLVDQNSTTIGFATGISPEGEVDVTNYHELKVKCRSYKQLTPYEQDILKQFWSHPTPQLQ
jgi:hypothetical protein